MGKLDGVESFVDIFNNIIILLHWCFDKISFITKSAFDISNEWLIKQIIVFMPLFH